MGTSGAASLPSSDVVTVRPRPVSTFLIVTVAPGTAAPELSVTLPRIVPRKVWAKVDAPAKSASENTTSASVRIARKKLFISHSLIDSIVILKPRECCGRGPRRSVQGHHGLLPMNILRERVRSKFFKRKCFQLNYETNRGKPGELRDAGRKPVQAAPRQLATWVGMR